LQFPVIEELHFVCESSDNDMAGNSNGKRFALL
jgi:hypothetical protein